MRERERGSRFITGTLFFGIILAAIATGSPMESFIDLPSLLMTAGGGALLTVITHGLGGLRELRRISKENGNRAEFEFAQTMAVGAAKHFERAGWIGFGIGAIMMLQQITDPNVIGPATAVALLCPLYGHLVSVSIFYPMARDMEAGSRMA
jgi:flagellar motor component MotA